MYIYIYHTIYNTQFTYCQTALVLNILICMPQYFIDTLGTVTMTHHPVYLCMVVGIKVTEVSLY